MSKNNRIKVFLLLGVMLVSIIISGCTPEQPTEPSKTEPGSNTVMFHELVNMDDISKIFISTSTNELMCILEDQKVVSDFQTTFESLKLRQIIKFTPSTSSVAVYRTDEYAECKEYIKTAYRIEAQLTDDTQLFFYIGTNGLVYYIGPLDDYYVSTEGTGYIIDYIKNMM